MAVLKINTPGDARPRIVPLIKKVTTIGSSPDCDVVLTGAGVERSHANIFHDGTSFTVQAAQAGNKVLLDGTTTRRKKLADGATLKIGRHELVFGETSVQEPCPTPRDEVELAAWRKMFEISTRLLSEYRLQPLLESVMDGVIELIGADSGFLLLLENGELSVKVARNLKRENIRDALEKVSDSIINRVLQNRQPLIVSDALNDLEFKSSESVVNLKLCSVVCVPLLHKGEIFGIIYAGNNRVASLFDERALRALIIFSTQIALILQSAFRPDEAQSNARAPSEQREQMRFGEVIGTAPAMQEVFRQVTRISPTDVYVLLEGEQGTGKKLVAREIHRRSSRAKGPFITINCSAIPHDLLRSELFGYVRGAFAGAVATKHGRIQQAHKGTLFLDEIEHAPPELQGAITRVLEEHAVTKVGDTHHEEIDVRVIAAFNTGSDDPIQTGLREELLSRLGAVRIVLPPLRDRESDIMLIAKYLLQRYAKEYSARAAGFSPSASEAMEKHRWLGNIGELENRIKKAVILSDHPAIDMKDLELTGLENEPILPLAQAREEFQIRYIHETLAHNHGNRTKTARDLGVDPRTIYRYLERMPEPVPAEEQPKKG
ncbi:MAG: sigma 54-interacting transcriptional regulator [Myxococcota bacterium]|jgi:transcriptional regulator with GAF, ATPase, and Fis domain